MHFRTPRLERFFQVHDSGQLLVIDIHQVGGVHRSVPGFGQHNSDRFALINSLFVGDRKSRWDLLLLGDKRRRDRHRAGEDLGEVLVGVDADNAGRFRRLGDVDAFDPSVGVRASDDG